MTATVPNVVCAGMPTKPPELPSVSILFRTMRSDSEKLRLNTA